MLVEKSLGSVRIISIDREALFHRLDEIAASMRKDFADIVQIVVFGSLARGDATGRSDLDVLVVLSGSEQDPLRRILAFRKYFDLRIPVDILVYTKKELEEAVEAGNLFVLRMLKEGVKL